MRSSADDLTALSARVEVLESIESAERKARMAAEAAARAASARADRLHLQLVRARGEPNPPFLRRHGLTVTVLLLAVGATVIYLWQRSGVVAVKQALDIRHSQLVAAQKRHRAEREKCDALRLQIEGLKKQRPDRLPPGDGEVGVPECDRYIKTYQACARDKVPAASRPMMLRGLKTVRQAWRRAAETEVGRKALAGACKTATVMAAKATKAYGCQW